MISPVPLPSSDAQKRKREQHRGSVELTSSRYVKKEKKNAARKKELELRKSGRQECETLQLH